METTVRVERNTRETSSHSSSKARRGPKKDNSASLRERRHRHGKAVKPTVPVRNKAVTGTESEEAVAPPEQSEEEKVKGNSTVINVDSVRDNEEEEEALGLLQWEQHEDGLKQRTLGVCEWLLIVVAVVIITLSFPLSIWLCVTVIREHERAVIFRLGHLLKGKPRGPGLLFYIPFLDVCQKVDIRLKMLKVPIHTVVTKDLVSTELSSACYYRVENVSLCFTVLSGVSSMLQALVQLTDREVLAHRTFNQILLDRKDITKEIQVALDAVTSKWGIKVERAEIEDVRIPAELQRSVAAEAEARRLAQIKVIAAEGERAVCEALKASIDTLSGSPAAVHLRLLQLLHTLRTDHPALVLNLPCDLMALPSDVSTTLGLPPATPTDDDPTKTSHTDSPMM
ncbi:podocin [Brienomyrus brachyistius]|uniref:podocin n=1 Tax=Brienomyrus brachyistius TaxID=42636 RepID=UPI0020B2D761|nr:podocin [Brienomyrus brachyistius]